jgi:hypothetical protein
MSLDNWGVFAGLALFWFWRFVCSVFGLFVPPVLSPQTLALKLCFHECITYGDTLFAYGKK